MSRAGRDTQIGHSQETLRGHSRDLQRIEFVRLQPRQHSLDGPPNVPLPFEAEDDRFDFTRDAKEPPSRIADFAIQSIAIEIPN
jgi:hypothetical protein